MKFTSIKLEDVEILEGIFAYLTDSGWEIPLWLIALRLHVENRDANG